MKKQDRRRGSGLLTGIVCLLALLLAGCDDDSSQTQTSRKKKGGENWNRLAVKNQNSHPMRLAEDSKGWIYVSRRGMHTHPESLAEAVVAPNETDVVRSDDHHRNFLDAIKTGKQTISPIEAAVRSEAVCLQAEIALRLRRKLRWDPVREEFIDDQQANRRLSRAMRSPWRL